MMHQDQEGIVVEVVDKPASNDDRITISWHNLELKVAQKGKPDKAILNGAFGHALPGELLAIMGGSGAGKSTLLDTIRGRIQPTSGQVLVNGAPHTKSFKHIASYVQQEDALIPVLTVRETITYAARFQLSSVLSQSAIDEKVNKMISMMGLQRCADTKIGNFLFRGISGGERRRVSICAELVTDPQVIFLDEPTSGLDSESAKQVIQMLSQLAKTYNKTIIATIHQPSSEVFALFDKIELLSQGRTIFHGSRDQALSYFDHALKKPCPAHYNPPDHYLSVFNTDFSLSPEQSNEVIRKYADTFKNSDVGSKLSANLKEIESKPGKAVATESYGVSSLRQTLILTERAYKNAGRNLLLYWIRAAMFIGMAILMGTTFYDVGLLQTEVQDRFSAHFFAVAFLCFMSVASIPGILEEKQVFDREVLNGAYNVGSFVVSNTLVSAPFVLLIALIFTAIVYPMIMFQSTVNNVLNYILFLFLALYTMESIVVCLASMVPIFVISLALAAFLNGFFMCVQGYFVRLSSLPKFWRYWAHYWSYQTYAFEALVKSDFDGLTFSCGSGPNCFCYFKSDLNSQCKFTGLDVLKDFGYDDVNLLHWAFVLLGQIIAYRIAMYVILKLKTKQKCL